MGEGTAGVYRRRGSVQVGQDGVMTDQFYFCLKHRTVEGEHGCKAADRLGPYDTSADAARALDKVAERNTEWENDPDWNDDAPRDTP
ncbi:hypothetical protein HMPREF0063_11163 [Aeromicrobium marinum DSM 15272]|uniref:Uncharacterized protein n=2 Tax=Aeromicrobium marinum TaxID=219314 RepID=E2SAV5_9ACTN|nr:hypothetical protein HMPREF0063_11163 [Aeromicrobium marinum DSM 15272]